MDKSLAGVIGAVGALVAAAPSQAAPLPVMSFDAAMEAHSYADLLKPIPNAAELLKAAPIPSSGVEEPVENVQYYRHHHHHHHHHHRYRRRHHHHHHHHHDYY